MAKYSRTEWRTLAETGLVERGEDGKNHVQDGVSVLTPEQMVASDNEVLEVDLLTIVESRIRELKEKESQRLGIALDAVVLTPEQLQRVWDIPTQIQYFRGQKSHILYTRETDSRY